MKKFSKIILALIITASLFAGLVPGAMAATPAEDAANMLYALGLFNGISSQADGTPDFGLKYPVTREESAVMLLRIIGKDELTLNLLPIEDLPTPKEIPFTDGISAWAENGVRIAYGLGLVNGTSATTFGGVEEITATQYLTLVLRALGYESGKDFEWDSAWTLSDKLGITNGEYNAENNKNFNRGDFAVISFNALNAINKTAGEPLFETLLYYGAIKRDAAESVGLISSKPVENKLRLTELPKSSYKGAVSYIGDTKSLEITTYGGAPNWFSGSSDPTVGYCSFIKNVGKTAIALKIDSKEYDADGELIGVSNEPFEISYLGVGAYCESYGEYEYDSVTVLERTVTVINANEIFNRGDVSALSLANKRIERDSDDIELVTITNSSSQDVSFTVFAIYFLDGKYNGSTSVYSKASARDNRICELVAPRVYNGVFFCFGNY
jgi:hypothetical protein